MHDSMTSDIDTPDNTPLPAPHFLAAQAAVDIVLTSPHPDSKVAACLFNGRQMCARTNSWPDAILEKFGKNVRIGDSSGTVHAEVNCIIGYHGKTENAQIAITDPCCPNCAKAIAEAGIKTVYIDHKGFQKDFAARRGDEFKDMSLSIMAHAGISIYEINRKAGTITPIYRPPNQFIVPELYPIEVKQQPAPITKDLLQHCIDTAHIKHPRWGAALATDDNGHIYSLIASTHPAIGYSPETVKDDHSNEGPNKKYDFYLEPLNRLIIGAKRYGLDLAPNHIWLSTLPTPRELVNAIGYGIHHLYIGEPDHSKKSASLEAVTLLTGNGLLDIEVLKRQEIR